MAAAIKFFIRISSVGKWFGIGCCV